MSGVWSQCRQSRRRSRGASSCAIAGLLFSCMYRRCLWASATSTWSNRRSSTQPSSTRPPPLLLPLLPLPHLLRHLPPPPLPHPPPPEPTTCQSVTLPIKSPSLYISSLSSASCRVFVSPVFDMIHSQTLSDFVHSGTTSSMKHSKKLDAICNRQSFLNPFV